MNKIEPATNRPAPAVAYPTNDKNRTEPTVYKMAPSVLKTLAVLEKYLQDMKHLLLLLVLLLATFVFMRMKSSIEILTNINDPRTNNPEPKSTKSSNVGRKSTLPTTKIRLAKRYNKENMLLRLAFETK